MKHLLNGISLLLVAASIFLCTRVIEDSTLNKQNKIDLAELNDIKYGLLSIDEWKVRITEILQTEIDKLNLAGIDQAEAKQHIEAVLITLIDKVASNIQKQNKGSVSGWVKQSFINIFVDLEDIKKGIPDYSKAIMAEVTSEKTNLQVKAALREQLFKYSAEIQATVDMSRRQSIIQANEATDVAGAKANLAKSILTTDVKIERHTWLLIALTVVLFVMMGYSSKAPDPAQYAFLVINLILLLMAGVMTPMIDLEAKIAKMAIVVLDHPLQFDNQVLYFQSKSIVDVFMVMMRDPDWLMKLVGILMVMFSIVFPALKLLSATGYYANWRGARDSAVIKFLVFKSGKWSMADVTVVAIFMAYIGFNGIIDSKLGQVQSTAEGPTLLATNGTSLQPGFYLFFAFAILAMFFTSFLTRHSSIVPPEQPEHRSS